MNDKAQPKAHTLRRIPLRKIRLVLLSLAGAGIVIVGVFADLLGLGANPGFGVKQVLLCFAGLWAITFGVLMHKNSSCAHRAESASQEREVKTPNLDKRFEYKFELYLHNENLRNSFDKFLPPIAFGIFAVLLPKYSNVGYVVLGISTLGSLLVYVLYMAIVHRVGVSHGKLKKELDEITGEDIRAHTYSDKPWLMIPFGIVRHSLGIALVVLWIILWHLVDTH